MMSGGTKAKQRQLHCTLLVFVQHRPRASKSNTTAAIAWQILDIRRARQIKDEGTHTLCQSKLNPTTQDTQPLTTTIFTWTRWTFISFGIRNLTDLQLGTQTPHTPSEHPKCDPTRTQLICDSLLLLPSGSQTHHTQIPADNLPANWTNLF